MKAKLFLEAIAKFLLGVLLVGALLFLPGTWGYGHGWLLMGLLFGPMLVAGLVMLFKDPRLLQSRLSAKEKQKEQSLVVKLSGLMFIAGFLLAGFGYRLGWYLLPRPVVITGAVIFLVAYGLYAEVLRENTWLSRTVSVQAGQQVIDRGLYGLVRHPMYFATVLLFLAMPLVLGSLYAFLVFLAYPVIIVFRIRHEEAFLEQELPGYREYKQRVKYRLLPFIW